MSWHISLFVAAHLVILAIFTLRILLRDDLSPPARLAWFAVLNAVPYFGSLIYFLFGEVSLGREANRRYALITQTLQNRTRAIFGQTQAIDGALDDIAPVYRPAFRHAASVNGFPVERGNRAALMASAQDTVSAMIRDIDSARHHVHVLYYIWLEDETGGQIAQALIRAAQRGVTCRALADGLGSRRLIRSALWREMRDKGVEVAVALPLDRPLHTMVTSRLDLRNHRKITVIDGRVTFIGSRNAADPAFLPKARFGPWVDVMLRLTGPVVAQQELLFASDWMQATGEELADIDVLAARVGPADGVQGQGFAATVIGDGPTERKGAMPQMFATLLGCAGARVTITTPYFVPDTAVLEALCGCAERGVDVRLIFPARNDSWIVSAASRSYYRRLLTSGCRIFEYDAGLLHAKTLTLDGQVVLIGSSNLDLRSFDLNYENNLLLQDAPLCAQLEARQDVYLAQAQEINLDAVLAWRFYTRIWHNVIATIGPVL
ncbi:Cardiolipin synthase [Aquimixticola soesokkakensis]|uniref:Cardiolipin synthase n=1 Tax=Aquimixticola soesokkakensis TaxID=1519096 RepID=A0A1Y5T4D7_9RHOB|nr:cardiolipin synthase [Aquimixticola soesokkakensis]SLN55512.1 Cardiolipin synthase [Aquimixticola soesokkakensis]